MVFHQLKLLLPPLVIFSLWPGYVPFHPAATNLPLTAIQNSEAHEQDYVDIGLFCTDVCRALDRGLGGRQLDEVSRSVRGAIEELATFVQLATYTLSN